MEPPARSTPRSTPTYPRRSHAIGCAMFSSGTCTRMMRGGCWSMAVRSRVLSGFQPTWWAALTPIPIFIRHPHTSPPSHARPPPPCSSGIPISIRHPHVHPPSPCPFPFPCTSHNRAHPYAHPYAHPIMSMSMSVSVSIPHHPYPTFSSPIQPNPIWSHPI